MRARLDLAAALVALAAVCGCGGSGESAPAQAGGPEGTLVVQLLQPNEPLAVLRVSTGELRVARLRTAGGDPPIRLARTGGHVVYYGGGGVNAIDPGLLRPPRKLGTPLYFVASETPGHVWFTTLRRGTPDTRRDLAPVSAVRVRDGAVTRSRGAPPCRGPTVVGATLGAVLCQRRSSLVAFDPTDGRVVRQMAGPFPLGTHGTLVAWCSRRCPRLHLTDVASGAERTVEPGPGFRFEEGYEDGFAPDGKLLAVPVQAERRQVALVDLTDGIARVVPGSRLGAYRNLAWSRSGEWLFVEAGRGRLMAYRPGSERAVPLPGRLPGPALDMVSGR